MSIIPIVDDTGFHAPTYEEILEEGKAGYRGIYGADIYLEPDSQDGASVAIEALAKYDTVLMAESVYRSFSPSTARGAGLSSMVKINGIGRHKSSFSVVPVRLVGQIGTTIVDGMVGGDSDVKWILPTPIVIPPTGEVLATATADRPGDHRAVPGDIYRILTPTRGWQDAVNTEAATPGAPVEEDGKLRQRQKISTALPSLTVLDGTIGAVANVRGVTRCRDYENDNSIVDANGLPPHSIAIVADGGDTDAIGDAINTKKTPGTGTYGTTRVLVTDEYGIPKYIHFFRPTVLDISASIRIRDYSGYVAQTGLNIKANVAEFINTMRIGMDLLRSRLICPIVQSEAVAGMRTFDVEIDDLKLAKNGEALAAANISVAFNEMTVCDPENITVIVDRDNA